MMRPSLSIRARILALVGAVIISFGAPAFVAWYRWEREDAERHVAATASLLARSIALEVEYPYAVGDDAAVARRLHAALQRDGVLYVQVDRGGDVIASAARPGVRFPAQPAQDARPRRIPSGHEVSEARHAVGAPDASGDSPFELFEGAVAPDPLLDDDEGRSDAPPAGFEVRIGVGYESARRELALRAREAASFALLMAAAVFGLAGWLASHVVRPLSRLRAATRSLGRGDLSTRVQVGGARELVSLVCSFNEMAARLEEGAERLAAEVARSRAMLDGMTDLLLVVDPHGVIRDANPALERALGVARGAFLGRPAASVVGAQLAGELPRLGARGARDVDATLAGPGGEPIPVHLTVSALDGAGGVPIGVLCVARDLRALRLADQLREANDRLQALLDERQSDVLTLQHARNEALEASRLKSEFLANMSHEIRTPINGVLGVGQILQGTDLDEDQKDLVRALLTSAEGLMTVINDVLDFSKVEAGKLEIESLAFDPAAVLEDVAELLAGRAQDKGLELVVAIDRRVPARTIGDAGRLRQVLVNLVGNAVKFTASGRVEVRIEAAAAGLLRFVVRDTGIGIPVEAQSRVFEPFRQADGSTTRRFGGTGLGLAISRRLVELMGGALHVESEPGLGATFSFTLPGTLDGERVTEKGALEVYRPGGVTKARVLIVEPDEAARTAIERMLRAWGLAGLGVGSATEGREVLGEALAAGEGYDLVLAARDLGEPALAALGSMAGAAPIVELVTWPSRRRSAATRDTASPRSIVKPVRRSALADCLTSALVRAPAPRARPADAAPSPARRASGGPKRPAVSAGRVLLAEDNQVNRLVVRRMLEGAGYEVEVVTDGLAAVERLAVRGFDVVVMDCQMPVMDGYQATRIIRSASGPVASIPIVALTANAMAGDREACLEAGMDDYLPKPVQKDRLLEALRRWCSRAAGAA